MSKLKPIRDLTKEQIDSHGLVNAYALQNMNDVDVYNSDRVYKIGDIISEYDTIRKKYILKICLCRTNGVYNGNHWANYEIPSALEITTNESLADDMLKLVVSLSGVINSDISFNHIYINDISDTNSMSVTSGILEPGKIFI